MSINDYIGLPFDENGIGPHYFNCWSLVVHVAKNEFGITYPSYSEQYSTPLDYEELNNLISGESKTNWVEVPLGQERPGDVIILRLRGIPIHAGLVIRKNKMLHVYKGIETTIDDYSRMMWKNRIDGIYRIE